MIWVKLQPGVWHLSERVSGPGRDGMEQHACACGRRGLASEKSEDGHPGPICEACSSVEKELTDGGH